LGNGKADPFKERPADPPFREGKKKTDRAESGSLLGREGCKNEKTETFRRKKKKVKEPSPIIEKFYIKKENLNR